VLEERRSSWEGFLREEARTAAALLGCSAGEVGTPWTCSYAEGAGGPVLRAGEESAKTVATHQVPNWAARIARLFRNHSNLGSLAAKKQTDS